MNPPLQREEIIKILASKEISHPPSEFIEFYLNFNGSKVLIGNAMWNFWKITECYLSKFNERDFLCFCDAYLETPIYGISINIGDPTFGKIFDLTYKSTIGLHLYEFLDKVQSDIDFFVQID